MESENNINEEVDVAEVEETDAEVTATTDQEDIEVVQDSADAEDDSDLLEEVVEPTEDEQAAHDASFDDESEEVANQDEQSEEVITDDFDWEIYDLALTASLGDAALSTEQRKNLPDSAFCGPARSFPVPDCAHVTAARRLIGRAKLSESQKAKVLACVNRKADRMSCDEEKDESLTELQKDYENALGRIQNLEGKLESAISIIAKYRNKDFAFAEDENKLEVLVTYFDSIKDSDIAEPKQTVVVDNPSVDSSDSLSAPASSRKLGSFENTVVKNYNSIVERDGLEAAESFLRSQARYLPRGFHPSKL